MKGRFTLANLVTIGVMFTIFTIFFEPMTLAFQGITNPQTNAALLTNMVLYSMPAMLLLGIIASPFILREKRKIIRRQQGGRRR